VRKEKQLLLDEITDKIDDMPSFVMTRYHKMSANIANDFRGELEKAQGELEVVRKRVLLKALEVAGIEGVDKSLLEGHIGVVFTKEDPVEVAKTIYDFSKGNENSIEVVGGRIEGKLYLADDVERLSKLPSKDQMRAQLIGTLQAPMAQTLSVMNSLLTSVMHCLENKAKKES
jgi:large subunit ribosomal protein L10